MENIILSPDSLYSIKQTIEIIEASKDDSLLEIIQSTATLIIALINIFLVIFIFIKNNRKSDNTNERNRKLALLKSLVLDYNMVYFYKFFEEINKNTECLLLNKLSIDNKQVINDRLKDSARTLRHKFIDVFFAIDRDLYDEILKITDILLDGITNSIFDEGINLSHQPKFDELITNKITTYKTQIIKILFDYRG